MLPGGFGASEAFHGPGTVNVVAMVVRDGATVGNVPVLFRVASGPNQGQEGHARSRYQTGYAYWSYQVQEAGADQVEVCADLNNNERCDSNEPRDSRRVWVGIRFAWTFSTGEPRQVRGQELEVTIQVLLGSQPWWQGRGVIVEFFPSSVRVDRLTTDGEGKVRVTMNESDGYLVTVCLDTSNNSNSSRRCPVDTGEPRESQYITWYELDGSGGGEGLAVQIGAVQLAIPSDACTNVSVRVLQGNRGVSGVRVLSRVTDGPNAQTEWVLRGTTDTVGSVSFEHCANNQVGIDTVAACVDRDGNGACDTDVPVASTPIWLGYQHELQLSTEAQFVGRGVTATYCARLGSGPLTGIRILFRMWPAGGSITPGPSSGQVTTGSDGCAAFTFSRTSIGSDRFDRIEACADLDGSGSCDGGFEQPAEPRLQARVGWGYASELRLHPYPGPYAEYLKTGVDTRSFTVEVLLQTSSGINLGGVAGQQVVASWRGANNGSQVVRTGPDGSARFAYPGSQVGEDVIHICLDTNTNGQCDSTEQWTEVRSYWMSQITVRPTVVDGWQPGDNAYDVRLTFTTDAPNVPVVVELENGGAQVAFDPEGRVRALRRWARPSRWSDAEAEVYVLQVNGDATFTVRVYLDRNDNGVLDQDERLMVAQQINLTSTPGP